MEEKPAFKSSFRRRRCLIPASGFYEWKKEGKYKQPMLITLPGGEVFAFAGIWDQWASPGGASVYSCSIITTDAAPGITDIHNRMPVMLTEEREYEMWLSLDDPLALRHLMQPYGGGRPGSLPGFHPGEQHTGRRPGVNKKVGLKQPNYLRPAGDPGPGEGIYPGANRRRAEAPRGSYPRYG